MPEYASKGAQAVQRNHFEAGRGEGFLRDVHQTRVFGPGGMRAGWFIGVVELREGALEVVVVILDPGVFGCLGGAGDFQPSPILLNLATEGNSTQVNYDGEVQVGGTIAGVGQRLLDTTSKMILKKFFEKLAEAAVE